MLKTCDFQTFSSVTLYTLKIIKYIRPLIYVDFIDIFHIWK